jgi:hypothetical protein
MSSRSKSWIRKDGYISSTGCCVRFTTNKVAEIEFSCVRKLSTLIRFCMQLTRKVDQPGFCVHLSVLWYTVELLLYDRRNWDFKKNKFKPELLTNFEYF